MTPNPTAIARAVGACLLCAAVLACGRAPATGSSETAAAARSSILPEGPPADFFAARAIGDAIGGNERPQIANVQVADLDGDGLLDVLVCDAVRNTVSWIRQSPPGTYNESPIARDITAPSHVEAIDFDGDRDLDLVVASLGVLFPDNRRIGSVIVVENQGAGRFSNHVAAQGIARVADARSGDLDGDGDLDLAVAAFGYDQGETLWLENLGGWKFEAHELQRLSGAVNAVVTDIDGDRDLDIVTIVSQEWEEIWAHVNDGRGRFTATLVWGSTNPDFGSSWLSMVDLDKDGDGDILYSNGDAFDYAPANSRPWHGVQWLENLGAMRFQFHRIADLSGASCPQTADLDGDGDEDVVAVSAYNRWEDPKARSIVWLENNGLQQFSLHAIASAPTHLITLAVGDLDGNGRADLVTGGMHISRPFDRISRIMLWSNRGIQPR